MTRDTREKLQGEETLNPGQRHYDDEFNRLTSSPDMKALDDQGDAAAREYDPNATKQSLSSLSGAEKANGKSEKQAVGDTAAGKAVVGAANIAGSPVAGQAVKLLSRIKTKKGGAVTGVVLIVMLLIIAVASILPFGLLVNLKENGTDWATRYTRIGLNSKIRQQLPKKIFDDPSACTGIGALCRYKKGLSETDIERLRTVVNIDDADIGRTADGRLFVKRMTFPGDAGDIDITKTNFAEIHKTVPRFQSGFNSIINPKALTFRSKFSIRKMSLFNVDRAKPLGDVTDETSALKNFRTRFYTSAKQALGFDTRTPDDTSSLTDQQRASAAALGDLEGVVNQQADAMRGSDIINDGPNPVVPDTTQLDGTKLATNTVSGGAKGAVMGVFATIDSACMIYNVIRIVNFGVKVYTAAALIQYAGLFTTIADKQKASDISAAEIAFVASILLRKSTMPASKGKDFSQSEGWQLISNGTIANPNELARFSVGSTASQALNTVYAAFNLGGTSREVCSKVLSWWGQGLLLGGGIITSILSGGTGALAGTGIGIAKGIALSFIQQMLVPRLIPIVAGVVAPDPKKDPEGGYGAGNAIAVGLMAFGSQMGRANGMRPLTKAQFAALQDSPDARTLAAVDKLERQKLGMFSLDNPDSVQNTVAMKLLPLMTPKSSVSEYISSAHNLVASTLPNVVSETAIAADTTDPYGSKYCDEEQTNAKLGIDAGADWMYDANCNLIYGPHPELIDNPKYADEANAQWMVDNGHIDPETAEPTSNDYKEYLELCPDGVDPVNDGMSADLEEGKDLSICWSSEEKYLHFESERQNTAVNTGLSAASENKLGQETYQSSADTSTAPPSLDSGGLVQGDPKLLAQQILASPNFSISDKYSYQINNYAAGDYSCNINPTILSMLATIVQEFKIYVSSLNRYCTGTYAGAGSTSYHYIDGGGHAVDIAIVNGVAYEGDANRAYSINYEGIDMLNYIVPKLPSGSRFLQGQCRPAGAVTNIPSGVTQGFKDFCNHQHIQVPIQ